MPSNDQEPLAADGGNAEIQLSKVAGRPMLTWVGKQPISAVSPLPAQRIEQYGDESSESGRLFHGDNKEALIHLISAGYRGKVKLVYIDPPFDSGADYVRKVTLRGAVKAVGVAAEPYSLGEQFQYTDIWVNDTYLQFMYERLILLKELMADDSVIYVHCDPTRNYQLRILMDEVFGQENFRNEIVWWYWNKFQGNVLRFASNHDTIICYKKGTAFFKPLKEERPEAIMQLKREWDSATGSLVNAKGADGKVMYIESTDKTVDDVWRIPMLQPADKTENLRFPTQKPETLLGMVIESSSEPGDLVLDCFCGSGTTLAVAQKLGRNWIGCDINRGAVQTSSMRLERSRSGGQLSDSLFSDDPVADTAFSVWRVNDYRMDIPHVESVKLVGEVLGMQPLKADSFFDGVLDGALVKVVPVDHPLTVTDLETLKSELAIRSDEDRSVRMACLGVEFSAEEWVSDWNRLRKGARAVNRIEVIELWTDPRAGGFMKHEPPAARVSVVRDGETAVVRIDDFVSPTVLRRLATTSGVVSPIVDDWRSTVDAILIDSNYDGDVLNVVESDTPLKRVNTVKGEYTIALATPDAVVAVKIVDVLGEETLVVDDPSHSE